MDYFVMVMQMEILLKFEEMCQDITKEFAPLFSKVKNYSIPITDKFRANVPLIFLDAHM